MILTTYGRSSGFCIDPIEKKPLNHFYPGSSILSFGTAGCNLGCQFCQNWDISQCQESDRLTDEATPVMIAQAAKKSDCQSVAFTYNDPVVFAEYAIDTAEECHTLGVKTVAVTAGYISKKARAEFFKFMDAANVDLKAFSEKFYQKFCSGHLQPVLDTLIYLKKETNVWLEITTLLIPGENDSDQELHDLTGWIAQELGDDVPLHFTAFHPAFQLMDKAATPLKTLTKARQIALSKGLHYAYIGNVSDKKNSSTYCHQCGKLIIERNWYEIGEYHIENGKCAYCSALCAGYFKDKPQGGHNRKPIRLNLKEE